MYYYHNQRVDLFFYVRYVVVVIIIYWMRRRNWSVLWIIMWINEKRSVLVFHFCRCLNINWFSCKPSRKGTHPWYWNYCEITSVWMWRISMEERHWWLSVSLHFEFSVEKDSLCSRPPSMAEMILRRSYLTTWERVRVSKSTTVERQRCIMLLKMPISL